MAGHWTEAFSLSGRVAVVTGAASGIGQESACLLAEAGAAVVLADLDEAGLATTAARIHDLGGKALVRRVDVSARSQVDQLALDAVSAFGRLDVWANVAAVDIHKPILEVSEADMDRQVAVNQKGVYWGCVAAGRAMTAQGSGSIVNLSSTGADKPSPGISVYSMTKAAVNACTRACAIEFAPSGVRVNAIGPGYVDTPMTQAAKETDPARRAAMLQAGAAISPMGLYGVPRDIALTVLYLASDASRFVTGQVLRPNGGATML